MDERSFRTYVLPIIVLFVAFIALAIVGIWDTASHIDTAQVITVFITVGLVSVTAFYAARTSVIADATREQAKASVRMSVEMDETRMAGVRPIVVLDFAQAPPTVRYYNIGTGPAINITIHLELPSYPPFEELRVPALGVLGVNEREASSRSIMTTDIEGFKTRNIPDWGYICEAKYENVYGDPFFTRLTFDEQGHPHLEIGPCPSQRSD